MPKPPEPRLFYVDERLNRSEVEEALKIAWEEIQLIEYDLFYDGFRGVHLDEEGEKIHVTFQLGSGGLDNAILATMDRETKKVKFAQAPKEMLEKEIGNLEQAFGVSLSELEEEDLADRIREVDDSS